MGRISPRQNHTWGYGILLVCLAITVYTIVFFWLQIRLYEGLHMQMWDLGIFDQALYGSYHGRLLQSSFTGQSLPVFTEHMYLILIVLLPLYGALPGVYTLFFVQALGIGSGALAIYLLAKHFSRSSTVAVLLGTAYLFYPSIQGMNLNIFMYGFHPDNLFPALLLFAFYFFLRKQTRTGYVFAALALMCGEHLAPTVAALGLYLILRHREQRSGGVVLLGVSVVWIVLSSALIIPYFRGTPPWYLARAITSETGALQAIPWDAVLQVTLQYVRNLLLPLLFTPLLDPLSLLISVPGLLLNYLACFTGYRTGYSPFSWHMAKLAPFVFLSATLGISHLVHRERIHPNGKRPGHVLAGLVLPACVLASTLWGPWTWNPAVATEQYAPLSPERAKTLASIESQIGPDDSLSTEPFWGSHFTAREILHFFPHAGWRGDDLVLVDTNSPLLTPWIMEQIEMLRRSPDHRRLLEADGVELYRYEPRDLPKIPSPLDVTFANHMRLLGYDVSPAHAAPGSELAIDLFWTADDYVDKSYSVFIHVVASDGHTVAQADSIPLNGSYPTDRWPTGRTMWDPYHLALGAELEPGQYEIETGLYYWEDGQRVAITGGDADPANSAVRLGSIVIDSAGQEQSDGT